MVQYAAQSEGQTLSTPEVLGFLMWLHISPSLLLSGGIVLATQTYISDCWGNLSSVEKVLQLLARVPYI